MTLISPPLPFQPLLEIWVGLRVDENQAAQLLRLGPERVKLGIGQFLAVHAAADRRAAQPELLHRVIELLGGEVRVLQRDRGKGDEAVRLRRAQRGELLVLQLDELTREVAVGLVPDRR